MIPVSTIGLEYVILLPLAAVAVLLLLFERLIRARSVKLQHGFIATHQHQILKTLNLSFVLLAGLFVWSIFHVERLQSMAILTPPENEAFGNSSTYGHLFVAIDDSTSASQSQMGDAIIQVGYLAPDKSAVTRWIGVRDEKLSLSEYPKINARIYIREITSNDVARKVREVVKSLEGSGLKGISNREVHPSNSRHAFCPYPTNSLLASKILSAMSEVESDENKANVTTIQFEASLIAQDFEPAETVVFDEVKNSHARNKLSIVSDKLKTWSQIRRKWDSMRY